MDAASHEALPQSTVPSTIRLAICGGGIAGLTLAIALGRYSHPDAPTRIAVDLYEAGPEITTVGAGISVWMRTWAVIRHLGLYEELAAASVEPPAESPDDWRIAFTFRKSDQAEEGFYFGKVKVPLGSTTMHRADMVEVLIRSLPESCTVHTSKRLLRYTESEGRGSNGLTLHFSDGTNAAADVLIGADGVKSATRASMYDIAHARDCIQSGLVGTAQTSRESCDRCKNATPKWTGTVAYRYLIPTAALLELNPEHQAAKVSWVVSYSGKGKHVITYRISHGKFINCVAFCTIPGGEGTPYPYKWVRDVPKEEVVSQYLGWEPEVEQIAQCMEKPSLWAIHTVEDLPFAADGRVAIIGDAVHAMTTHFGAGGGQAIEDSVLLGQLLADPRVTLARIPAVMKIYESVRLPFANFVVKHANKVGLMYEFNAPCPYDGDHTPYVNGSTDAARGAGPTKCENAQGDLDELAAAIQRMWNWQSAERVETQWAEAQEKLEALLNGGPCEAGEGPR